MLLCIPGLHAQDADTSKVLPVHEKQPAFMENPSVWINDCYNRLNGLYLYQTEREIDTTTLFTKFRDHLVVITMLKNDFYGKSATLNIRTVYNMKMRVADILANITLWQNRIHADNELLVEKSRELLRIKSEIAQFRQHADSLFRFNFKDAVERISARQQTGEALIMNTLRKSTAIETKIVDINTQVYIFYSDICSLLQTKEASLAHRELPPIWKSPPSVYPSTIRNVLTDSFQQTLESVKYYGEMSLWRIIIFRLMILLLCLVPIKLFNNEQRKQKILSGTDFTFLAKFPKTASVIMGMALSPIIFVHPPHAFLEFILIGLVFTVTMLTFKNYPKLNKTLIVLLIVSFLILYLINFFVTPTFPGRLMYTMSILLLVPIYLVYKQLPSYGLEYEKEVRLMLIILAIHLVAGWILVILGYYTLGRSVILSAYLLLILSMILRIAVYTLLDYIDIIAYFFNKRAKTVKINAKFVHARTKPLLFMLAGIFLVIAYLFNMNIFDLVKLGIKDIMLMPRKIGSASFTLWSIMLFFASVYFSFILASLLRHTFDPQHEQTVEKRSSLGSYLLLLRLLILCAGFTIGILASGLPLTNFTILLGAMGVGIGFGLQNIVSNLISGLIIAFERPFVVGDVLEFGTETCKVKEISLRATMVSTSDGADILIPNNTLLSENLKNWTISNKQRFLEMKVQTTHHVNPEHAMNIIGKCLEGTENIILERCVVVLSEINDTGLVFSVKILVTDLANGSKIRSHLLSAIHAAFHENNIRFPKKNTHQEETAG
jgi:small-conductance mechanosensitive channel